MFCAVLMSLIHVGRWVLGPTQISQSNKLQQFYATECKKWIVNLCETYLYLNERHTQHFHILKCFNPQADFKFYLPKYGHRCSNTSTKSNEHKSTNTYHNNSTINPAINIIHISKFFFSIKINFKYEPCKLKI